MKAYVYQLFYVSESRLLGTLDQPCGYFTSLNEVRAYIKEDGSPRDDFRAFRFKLNCMDDQGVEGVEVEIKW